MRLRGWGEKETRECEDTDGEMMEMTGYVGFEEEMGGGSIIGRLAESQPLKTYRERRREWEEPYINKI